MYITLKLSNITDHITYTYCDIHYWNLTSNIAQTYMTYICREISRPVRLSHRISSQPWLTRSGGSIIQSRLQQRVCVTYGMPHTYVPSHTCIHTQVQGHILIHRLTVNTQRDTWNIQRFTDTFTLLSHMYLFSTTEHTAISPIHC